MFNFKKYIALLSLMILLIPTAIQLEHAIDNHEHTVCTSVDEHHYHEQDVDCSQFHYQLEVFSHNFSTNYAVIPITYYKDSYNFKPQIIANLYFVKKATRGPPFIYNS